MTKHLHHALRAMMHFSGGYFHKETNKQTKIKKIIPQMKKRSFSTV
jgi:hypothetical protein